MEFARLCRGSKKPITTLERRSLFLNKQRPSEAPITLSQKSWAGLTEQRAHATSTHDTTRRPRVPVHTPQHDTSHAHATAALRFDAASTKLLSVAHAESSCRRLRRGLRLGSREGPVVADLEHARAALAPNRLAEARAGVARDLPLAAVLVGDLVVARKE